MGTRLQLLEWYASDEVGPAIAAHSTATTIITAKTIVRCPRGALSGGHAPPRS